MQNHTKDIFYPLESAASSIAFKKWNDTEANRAFAVEVWRLKYPEQLAPLLNGEVCDRGYLAHLQHDTEVEIQEAINNLLSDGLLTLYSPNTQMATRNLAGAFISKNELFRLIHEMVTMSGISDVIKLDRESFEQDKAESHRRRTLGRYTLKEAAILICKETGERTDEMLKKLIKAVSDKILPVFEPSKNALYQSKTVRTFYEEAYWNDLNMWLGENETRLTWQFPTPEKTSLPIEALQSTQFIGLTKQPIINAFEGIKWNRDKWSKNLASPPKWLIECRVSKGNKSVSATWSPVSIAIALLDKRITLTRLDSVFVGLKNWTDEWQEKTEIMR